MNTTTATTAPADHTWPAFELGMKIRFADEKQSYTVQAVSPSGRFVVCTKPFNARRTVLYSVIDLAQGIRGADNRVFGMGYETPEECQYAAAAFDAGAYFAHLAAGDAALDINDPTWLSRHPALADPDGNAYPRNTEISYRNWVWLRLDDHQPDRRTQELLPALRALLAQAPPRNYNDYEPRTPAELERRPA